MSNLLRITIIAVLCLAIVLSCAVFAPRLSDPSSYSHIIEVLDGNRSTVLGLSAASAAASAAVSALPDDICSPIAEELSDFSTWFLIILTVVYLEKYLLTIFGFVACYILIPAGCAAMIIHCFFPAGFLRQLGIKLIALGAVLVLIIPSSVWVCDKINDIYSESIRVTVDAADSASAKLMEDAAEEDGKDATVIDRAAAIIGDLSGSAAKITAQFKNVINRFVEATAVMVVTNCLVPILVLLFYGWIIKTLFGLQIALPAHLTKPFGRHSHNNAAVLPPEEKIEE